MRKRSREYLVTFSSDQWIGGLPMINNVPALEFFPIGEGHDFTIAVRAADSRSAIVEDQLEVTQDRVPPYTRGCITIRCPIPRGAPITWGDDEITGTIEITES